jgi:hypothetical protein
MITLFRCAQGHLYCVGHVTIRETTDEERSTGWHHPFGSRRSDYGKYLTINADTGDWVGAFFMPHTADTREEIVYWAERFAGKNGWTFIRPAGWEDVEGALPDD